MSAVDVVQGSMAWLKERKKGITASDSGVVCGVSPYSTARALWQLKSGRVRRDDDEPESEATAHGHRYESAIAEHYELLTTNAVHQAKFYWHRDQNKRYGASPDGFVDDWRVSPDQRRGLIEIKAPFRRAFDYIPPEYMCQMQMQMEVCDLPWCDFVCFFATTESFRVWRVYRSRLHWRWMEAKLARFLESLDSDVEPTASEFPSVFREAIDQAKDVPGVAVTAAMRQQLPPKVHSVDVLTVRCQLDELTWYVERKRIQKLRAEFSARATPATEPIVGWLDPPQEAATEMDDVVDPAVGLHARRSEFVRNMQIWNDVMNLRSVELERAAPEPAAINAVTMSLPDWLAAPQRSSPRQLAQSIDVATSPLTRVAVARNGAWTRAPPGAPRVLWRAAVAMAISGTIFVALASLIVGYVN